jgi:hypothetical protein
MPKRKSRRSREKYPALYPHLNVKSKYEMFDMDYVKELPDKPVPHCGNSDGKCKVCNNPKTRFINPKDYLNRFMEEFANADFHHDGKKLDDSPKARKEAYNRSNARYRDLLNQLKINQSLLVDIEKLHEFNSFQNRIFMNPNFEDQSYSPEDFAIFIEELKELLNNKNLRKNIKNKKLLKDFKERLEEYESMDYKSDDSDDSSSGG